VPAGAILDLAAALDQPQVRHRQTIRAVAGDGLGELKLLGLSARFSATPGALDTAPPRLSADTGDLLLSLGYSREEISGLRQRGVV
jgi:crotonobetainyl-CoA:carnitine CoA-transferase CaiB-like acyl-CoA transferase